MRIISANHRAPIPLVSQLALGLALGAGLLLGSPGVAHAQGSFLRGDANFDGHIDITDPIVIVRALYYGQGQLVCEDAADANDDGAVDISDVSAILGYLYGGTDELAAPFFGSGEDPTEDLLGCEAGVESEPEPEPDTTVDGCGVAVVCSSDFVIEDSDDLHAAAQCSSIEGDLSILTGDRLTDVDLPCLESVEALLIEDTETLTSISLSSLTSLSGSLRVVFNEALTDLDGLSSLSSGVRDLEIHHNEELRDIDGLSGLSAIEEDVFITNNPELVDVDGLSNLGSVGGFLDLLENLALTHFDLASLTSVGDPSSVTTVANGLRIISNPELINVHLPSLTSVAGHLDILWNQALTTVAIPNLASVGGERSIENNDALTDITVPGLAPTGPTCGDTFEVEAAGSGFQNYSQGCVRIPLGPGGVPWGLGGSCELPSSLTNRFQQRAFNNFRDDALSAVDCPAQCTATMIDSDYERSVEVGDTRWVRTYCDNPFNYPTWSLNRKCSGRVIHRLAGTATVQCTAP